jgi:hypothetical protein
MKKSYAEIRREWYKNWKDVPRGTSKFTTETKVTPKRFKTKSGAIKYVIDDATPMERFYADMDVLHKKTGMYEVIHGTSTNPDNDPHKYLMEQLF